MTLTSAKWREQRRTILSEIIAENSSNEFSYRQISEEMRHHPVVARAQPDYSKMTAYRDWLVIRDELIDRRRELASKYIGEQLEITEQLLEDLISQYQRLEEEEAGIQDIEDPIVRVRLRISVAGAKKRLVEAIDKMLYRQHTLIPIAIPKQLNVNSTEVSFSLDDFLKLRQSALNELGDGETIEGEIVDG